MYDLGMSADDFWNSTPAIYDKLVARHDAAVERDYYRTGILCSLIANMMRDSKKKPTAYRPADFMPRTEAEEDEVMSPEEMLDRFHAGFGHLIKQTEH